MSPHDLLEVQIRVLLAVRRTVLREYIAFLRCTSLTLPTQPGHIGEKHPMPLRSNTDPLNLQQLAIAQINHIRSMGIRNVRCFAIRATLIFGPLAKPDSRDDGRNSPHTHGTGTKPS